MAWSPDGRYVLSAMQENALHGWWLGDGEHLRMAGYPAKSRSLSWSARGRWLLTSGAPALVALPSAGRGGPIGKPALEPATRLVTRVAGHATQEVLAAVNEDGAVRLLRLPDGAGREIARGEGAVAALAWGTEGGSAGVFAPARAAA